ncbi:hypothetical protein QF026_005508 [Streptomyces aurantiacus]|nr:hypothetical protein [Streptomyces aurantiacus]
MSGSELAGFDREGREGDDEVVTEGERLALGPRLFGGAADSDSGADSGRLVAEASGRTPCAAPSALIGSACGGS